MALRAVQGESTDYAVREYGATSEQVDRFTKKLHEEGEKDRKAGRRKTSTGDIEAALKG